MLKPLSGDANFLYSFGNFGIRPGLNNITEILSKLGNPQQHPQIIHIAGTNGKGTTVITLEQLLLASGYSVGSTISPHLIRLNERFRLNGGNISDEALWKLLCRIYAVCGITDKNKHDPEKWKMRPTFFEMIIVAVFMWFRENNPDFVILETGLGGKLDATNIADSMLQIITPVSLDHEIYLGNTLEEISDEKAGIMKQGKTVIFGKQQPHILTRLHTHAERLQMNVFEIGKHIRYKRLSNGKMSFVTDTEFLQDEITINTPALQGNHQFDNIAVSLLAYNLLCQTDKRQPHKQINALFKNLRFKGRLDEISVSPRIICDGAHNTDGMRVLLSFLKETFKGKNLLMAITRMKDKHFEEVLMDIVEPNITFQPLTISYERALTGKETAKLLKKTGKPVKPPLTVSEFVKKIITTAGEKYENTYDAIIVCGSFYLLGEFYDCYEQARTSPDFPDYRYVNTNV